MLTRPALLYNPLMRLFIGVPLSSIVDDELSSLVARLRPRAGSLRWTAPASWHVTLQFLGNSSPDQLACLEKRLAEIHHPSVPMQLPGIGFFDSAGVFYASVQLSPELISLQQKVLAATASCGYEPETRPFHPHMTLARAKGPAGARDLRALQSTLRAELAFTAFIAREFLLYESHLGPTGARYDVRARFPLAG
jgi:RNA 2',3'-cyclic 3'-phosphodiesterase